MASIAEILAVLAGVADAAIFEKAGYEISSSFAPALNKYAHQSSQSANPFVVSSGQLDVALGVLEGLVAQPLLQHWDRHAAALNRLTGDFRNLGAEYASNDCRSARLNRVIIPAGICVNRG